MICTNCKLKKICKNYDYLQEHDELVVSSCKFRTEQEITLSPLFYEQHKKEKSDININDNTDNNISEFKPKLVKQKEPEQKLITCPTCKAKTFESDLKTCSKCGKTVCSNCSTESSQVTIGDLESLGVLCNECYGIDDNNKETYNSTSSIKDLLGFNFDDDIEISIDNDEGDDNNEKTDK